MVHKLHFEKFAFMTKYDIDRFWWCTVVELRCRGKTDVSTKGYKVWLFFIPKHLFYNYFIYFTSFKCKNENIMIEGFTNLNIVNKFNSNFDLIFSINKLRDTAFCVLVEL